MLRRHTATVPGERVIIRCLVFVAPIADDPKVAIVVGASEFERQRMVDVPIVSRAELA